MARLNEPDAATTSPRANTIRRCIDAGRKMRACNELAPAALAEVFGLLDERQRLRAALEELLDVAERIRGGDPKLDPERWHAARDYAKVVLRDTDLPLDACSRCGGSGQEPEVEGHYRGPVACDRCEGTGKEPERDG